MPIKSKSTKSKLEAALKEIEFLKKKLSDISELPRWDPVDHPMEDDEDVMSESSWGSWVEFFALERILARKDEG
jgi:hypothetical protein